MKVLLVVRNCCLSGNCGICLENGVLGHTELVCQFLTTCPEMADKVAHEFREYHAEVQDAIEENISRLQERSARYVREKLLKPQFINNHLIGGKK